MVSYFKTFATFATFVITQSYTFVHQKSVGVCNNYIFSIYTYTILANSRATLRWY